MRCAASGLFKGAPYVRNRVLLDRYDAVGWVLITCGLEAARGHAVDTWYIIRAIDNARRSCASFIMDEPLPDAASPSRADVSAMVKRRHGGHDWSALSDWLEEHSGD